MRASGRWRVLAVLGAGVATAAAVLAVALPLSASAPSSVVLVVRNASRRRCGGGHELVATGTGDTVCGDVRFDKAKLPGRRATVDNGDWPTAAAADLLRLHGWPRAVPYDVAQWTVVTDGAAGVLVASCPAPASTTCRSTRPPTAAGRSGRPARHTDLNLRRAVCRMRAGSAERAAEPTLVDPPVAELLAVDPDHRHEVAELGPQPGVGVHVGLGPADAGLGGHPLDQAAGVVAEVAARAGEQLDGPDGHDGSLVRPRPG